MKNRKLAALAVAAVLVVSGGTATAVAAATPNTNDGVCQPQNAHLSPTNDGDLTTETYVAPEGQLIAGYCVKAGSDNQGNGPHYVTLPEPVASVTFSHPSGKDISHFTITLVPVTPDEPEVCEPPLVGTPPNCEEPPTEEPEVCEPPTTGTPPNCVTPTTPPVTPVTPETPTETPTETPEETPETPDDDNDGPKSTPQPPKDKQVIECVDGVFVTTVNGEVISESGSCVERDENDEPKTFSETGL